MEFWEQLWPNCLGILLLYVVSIFLLLLGILLNVVVLGKVDVWIVIVNDCYTQRWVQFLLPNQRAHFYYSLACYGSPMIRHYNLFLHVAFWSNLERFGRNLMRHNITFFLVAKFFLRVLRRANLAISCSICVVSRLTSLILICVIINTVNMPGFIFWPYN